MKTQASYEAFNSQTEPEKVRALLSRTAIGIPFAVREPGEVVIVSAEIDGAGVVVCQGLLPQEMVGVVIYHGPDGYRYNCRKATIKELARTGAQIIEL